MFRLTQGSPRPTSRPGRENQQLSIPGEPPLPLEPREALRADDREALPSRLVEPVVRHARARVPVGDEPVPVEHRERVRGDLPRELLIERGLRLRGGLFELRGVPLQGTEFLQDPVEERDRIRLLVPDAESLERPVVREEHASTGHLPPERVAEVCSDLVPPRRPTDMGEQQERRVHEPPPRPRGPPALRGRGGPPGPPPGHPPPPPPARPPP